jgi:tetrapyrrole methylase family protein/MazG family protein
LSARIVGPELITTATQDLLDSHPHVLLRTKRHPAAVVADHRGSFDDVYDAASTLDEVYTTIFERLVGAAREHGEIVYAVPGSPTVAERTVSLLIDAAERGDLTVDVHPALSFVELAWVRLGVDPVASGARLVDGQRFAEDAAGERGPLLVAQCDSRLVLSDVKLAVDEPPPEALTVLHHLGLPDEEVFEVAWDDLDRSVEPDHLTSLWIPMLAAPIAPEMRGLAELTHILRRECPWDREQTHTSLVRHLVEEAYEVVEAIEVLDQSSGAGFAELEEELGDLLFQVVLHAELATEEGRFTLADVARGIHEKLEARHPHVFGEVEIESAAGVEASWDRLKRAEKGRASAMDGIPGALPALLLALKVHERAARGGMPFPTLESAYEKVAEELAETRAKPDETEVGDLLFAAVGLANELGVEPEAALRAAVGRFRERFVRVEQLAASEGIDLLDAEQVTIDRLWETAKRESGGSPGIERPLDSVEGPD